MNDVDAVNRSALPTDTAVSACGARRTQHLEAAIAPTGAPIRDRDPWAVFVAANGQARRRRVKLGGCTASAAWIEERPAPGGLVIVYLSESGQT